MERLRRRSPEVELPAPPTIAPLALVPAGELPPPPPIVQVIWGPIAEAMAFVGMTVGEVRALLRGPFNIPGHAFTHVNGARVTMQHRLIAGETLEFVREAGEKGAAP